MQRTGRLLFFWFVFFLTISGLQAQYINADSLVHLPGQESPLIISEIISQMEEMPVDNLLAGQEFFYGQHIPAGSLLSLSPG